MWTPEYDVRENLVDYLHEVKNSLSKINDPTLDPQIRAAYVALIAGEMGNHYHILRGMKGHVGSERGEDLLADLIGKMEPIVTSAPNVGIEHLPQIDKVLISFAELSSLLEPETAEL